MSGPAWPSPATAMRFINPKTDFASKRIFGADHSGPIVKSFLNALRKSAMGTERLGLPGLALLPRKTDGTESL